MIDAKPIWSPSVSVLLPVYNGANYLFAAVQSILDQDFLDFELLAIDDVSTDDSLATLLAFAQRDGRIKIVTRENRGLVATLNEGIQIAKGRYIARMDADDIAVPERLRLQFEFMEATPKCVCVGSDVELIDELGRKLVVWNQLSADADIQKGALQGHGTICHPSALIRTDVLLRVGGYRPEMYPAEDLDLWLRLGEVGTLANLDKVLLRYRMHSQSISGLAAKSGRQRDAARKCCDDACQRRGLRQSAFAANEAWRPDGTQDSALAYDLKFGWWAYSSKEYRTASSYGWRAWRQSPLSKEALSLLLKSTLLKLKA